MDETEGMPYDGARADRVRASLKDTNAVTELRMFGGWGITIHGNMAVGVMNNDLIVRVGPDRYEDALARPGARPFDFTGRSMTGWVYVDGSAVTNARALNRWVRSGVEFAQSLPRKAKTSRKRSAL